MDLKNASVALMLWGLCCLAACGGESKPSPGSTLPPGTVVPNPGTGTLFVVELNEGGNAQQLEMIGQPLWGRLADIYALEPITGQPKLYFTDFLIGQEIKSDGVDFDLERNVVTAKENLTILHTFGSANYLVAFGRIEVGLQPFLDKSMEPSELPPFTALPRNAAMVVRFNDLLRDGGNPGSGQYPGSVTPTNVKLELGYPPIGVGGARILPDPNHGDIINGVFHSTRLLIDMSVSQAEAVNAGVLPNALGLPAAVTTALPNVVMRIPTIVNAGAVQFEILTNLSGNGLGSFSNGSSDPFSPTLDIVRAFRSGGRTAITGDLYNGFLRDDAPPEVLGSQEVTVTMVAPTGLEFLVDMQYSTVACATQPQPGDVLVLPGIVAEVTQLGAVPVGGAVASVQMKLIGGSVINFTPGPGSFRMPWDPALGVQAECFVRFSPVAGLLPDQLVSNDSSVVIAFSEPVYPRSANGFTGMRVGYMPAPASSMQSHVVGSSTTNQDLTEVIFNPTTKLNHTQGASESYSIDVIGGPLGIVDLAGNSLALSLPQTTFSLLSIEPTVASGSIALQFSDTTLDEDGDTFPDLRGQLILNPGIGEITSRSVEHFSAIADDSQLTIGQMSPTIPFTIPAIPVTTQIPMSPYGSRLQAAWRHVDLGLSTVNLVTDPVTLLVTPESWSDAVYNIDVEGLAWAPFAAGLVGDFFPGFQLALTHSHFTPEEQNPAAGIQAPFAGNSLANHPPEIVHQKSDGYSIQNLDLFLSASQTLMAPWPLNRNKTVSDYSYFTYRDTTILEVAGASGNGGDPPIWLVPPPSGGDIPGLLVYPGGSVPTICLPLLMDFRVYQSSALGLNYQAGRVDPFGLGFTSFRAYSAGYQPAGTGAVFVNPDQETQAAGTLVGGVPSLPIDDVLTLGQVDFVVRVNQVHSVWFDAGALTNWKPAVFDPPNEDQPDGTSVSIAYRGAVKMIGSSFNDATKLDPYGDPLDLFDPNGPNPGVFTPTYLNGDSTWKTNMSDLDGAKFIQIRLTLTSNVETGVLPSLSAVGLAFEK